MRKFTTLFFVLIITLYGYAQDRSSHSISIGSAAVTMKDSSVFNGSIDQSMTRVGYDFERETSGRKSRVSLSVQKGRFTLPEGHASWSSFSLGVTNGYRFIQSKDRRFKGYVGYNINVNPSFTKVVGKTPDYYSWSSVNTVGLYQSYGYSWEKSRLDLDIHFPLAGFMSRPGKDILYPSDMNGALYNVYSDAKFISWHNYNAYNFSLKYSRAIGKRVSLFVKLYHSYNNLKTELPVRLREWGVMTGISIRL